MSNVNAKFHRTAPPAGFVPSSAFRPVPANEKAFDGLIAKRGLAVVYGPPGTGKTSWLMSRFYHWGEAAAAVGPRASGLNVLYIALEGVDAAREWAAAHRRTRPARYIDVGYRIDSNLVVLAPDEFPLLDRPKLDAWLDSVDAGGCISGGDMWQEGIPKGLPKEEDDAWFLDWATVTTPDVIIVDSLSRALGGVDENDNSAMSQAMEALEYIRDAFGARLLVLVHHPAAGTTRLRGATSLDAAMDSATHIGRKGDTLVVRNTKARNFADGAVKRYRRRPAPSYGLTPYEPDLFRMEFDELAPGADGGKAPDVPAGVSSEQPQALPAPVAVMDAPAPQDAPPTATGALEPESAPPPPTQPAHPADALTGRPARLWAALGLPPGTSLAKSEAMERLRVHPAMVDVEPRRRSVRIREVFTTFDRHGLMNGEVIRNPA